MLWYFLSSGYSLYAKAALNGDRLASDSVLTLWQFVWGVVGSVVMLRGDVGRILVEMQQGGALTLAIATAYAAGAALTSASMAMGSVAIAYVIKSTEPLMSVALSFVLLGQRFSLSTLLALLPLCLGLVLACYSPSPANSKSNDAFPQWVGAFLALAANLGMAARNVSTKLRQHLSSGRAQGRGTDSAVLAAANTSHKRIVSIMDDGLSEHEGHAHAPSGPRFNGAIEPHPESYSNRVADDEEAGFGNAQDPESARWGGSVQAPAGDSLSGPVARFGAVSAWACVIGLAFVVLDSSGRAQAHMRTLWPRLWEGRSSDVMFVVSAACHAGYTLCSFVALQRLEAASHAVATALKQLFVIVCAAVALGSPLSLSQGIGACVAVAGVIAYGRARSRDPLAAVLQPPLLMQTISQQWAVLLVACGVLVVALARARPYPPPYATL